MKPTKETVALVVTGLFGIAIWVLSLLLPTIPSGVFDFLKLIWGIALPFVLAWLYRALQIELAKMRDEITMLRAGLRLK